MKVISSKGVSDSCSDNPKPVLSFAEGSAIQNPKWLGLSLIAFVLVVVGPLANAQQSKKVFRLGFISVQDSASESARAEAIRLALRERGYIEDRTSPSSTDMRMGSAIGCLSLPLNWYGSTLMSSWR